jgi:hypothetical protein
MDVDGNGRISQEELLSTAKSVVEAEKYMRAASAAAASSMRGGGGSASATHALPEVGHAFKAHKSLYTVLSSQAAGKQMASRFQLTRDLAMLVCVQS